MLDLIWFQTVLQVQSSGILESFFEKFNFETCRQHKILQIYPACGHMFNLCLLVSTADNLCK